MKEFLVEGFRIHAKEMLLVKLGHVIEYLLSNLGMLADHKSTIPNLDMHYNGYDKLTKMIH
jgi:hypothetical protein